MAILFGETTAAPNMLDIILIFVATLLLIQWINNKAKRYPPGPPCLPLIGSAPFVQSANFHFYLEKQREKYGNVVGFKFGPRHTIGVAGVKEVREVLTREEFQGRPELSNFRPGIMFNEGEQWLIQRRFALKHLREFGFGKKTVEFVILEEAQEFFENVLRQKKTVQVTGLFSLSFINVLWAMMGGERYPHNNAEFKTLLDCIQVFFRTGNITGGLLEGIPILRKILYNCKSVKEPIRLVNALRSFLKKAIISHKETKTDTPRDFIDMYLIELENPDKHSSFSESMLINVCVDLFSAGAESVANYLSFCVLYCVLYPKWQEELYEEIKNYDTSEPYLANRQRFPKVEAFLSEVGRCNPIASMTVPHKSTRDTELNGYYIPKNATVLVSLWSVLQDKEMWKDPKNFRPERFLDENGSYRKDVGWVPIFGISKRVCPGETLSRDMLFVFFIALIREFKFSIPEGHPRPSTLCMAGFTHSPQPFEVNIVSR